MSMPELAVILPARLIASLPFDNLVCSSLSAKHCPHVAHQEFRMLMCIEMSDLP